MKKILLNLCLALLLSTSVQANTSLVSVGAETPWGTTIVMNTILMEMD